MYVIITRIYEANLPNLTDIITAGATHLDGAETELLLRDGRVLDLQPAGSLDLVTDQEGLQGAGIGAKHVTECFPLQVLGQRLVLRLKRPTAERSALVLA